MSLTLSSEKSYLWCVAKLSNKVGTYTLELQLKRDSKRIARQNWHHFSTFGSIEHKNALYSPDWTLSQNLYSRVCKKQFDIKYPKMNKKCQQIFVFEIRIQHIELHNWFFFYKRPWWESLPSNKNQKNKVILDEYDKIKSSAPKWPWMTALKAHFLY